MVTEIRGISKHSKLYLDQYGSIIERSFSDLPFPHLSVNLSVEDLRLLDRENRDVKYPGYSYSVNNKVAKTQSSEIASFYNNLSLSFAYDVFEDFIRKLPPVIYDSGKDKNIIEKFLEKYRQRSKADAGFSNFNPGSNNSNHFRILRTLLPDLKGIEEKNNRKIDLSIWYKCFSIYRHSIVHNKMAFNEEKHKKELKEVKSYFPVKQIDNERLVFWIDLETLETNLGIIADYAYLLIKLINEKYGLEIK